MYEILTSGCNLLHCLRAFGQVIAKGNNTHLAGAPAPAVSFVEQGANGKNTDDTRGFRRARG